MAKICSRGFFFVVLYIFGECGVAGWDKNRMLLSPRYCRQVILRHWRKCRCKCINKQIRVSKMKSFMHGKVSSWHLMFCGQKQKGVRLTMWVFIAFSFDDWPTVASTPICSKSKCGQALDGYQSPAFLCHRLKAYVFFDPAVHLL